VGNFMNQELYGPPNELALGIGSMSIRVAEFACPRFRSDGDSRPALQALFFYESILKLLAWA